MTNVEPQALLPGNAHRSLPAVLCMLGVLLSGCSTIRAPEAKPATAAAVAGERDTTASSPEWRYFRFRFERPDDDSVNSYLDLMVADRVLSPVIAAHDGDLPLWRFHRRWPKDRTGHQFSFIYFADEPTARSVSTQISAHPLIASLRRNGYLVEHRLDRADPARASDVGATSDRNWPDAVQREWPVFIMGASRMWLGLLRSEAASRAEAPLHARYKAAEEALDAIWYAKGNHAFFHHLSALFGYKPLRVIRRDVMTF